MFATQHEKLNSAGLLDPNGIYIFSDSCGNVHAAASTELQSFQIDMNVAEDVLVVNALLSLSFLF